MHAQFAEIGMSQLLGHDQVESATTQRRVRFLRCQRKRTQKRCRIFGSGSHGVIRYGEHDLPLIRAMLGPDSDGSFFMRCLQHCATRLQIAPETICASQYTPGRSAETQISNRARRIAALASKMGRRFSTMSTSRAGVRRIGSVPDSNAGESTKSVSSRFRSPTRSATISRYRD